MGREGIWISGGHTAGDSVPDDVTQARRKLTIAWKRSLIAANEFLKASGLFREFLPFAMLKVKQKEEEKTGGCQAKSVDAWDKALARWKNARWYHVFIGSRLVRQNLVVRFYERFAYTATNSIRERRSEANARPAYEYHPKTVSSPFFDPAIPIPPSFSLSIFRASPAAGATGDDVTRMLDLGAWPVTCNPLRRWGVGGKEAFER